MNPDSSLPDLSPCSTRETLTEANLRPTRRTFLKFCGSLVAGAAALGAYGYFIEAKWLELTEKSLADTAIGKLSGLKILHLSDLHASKQVSVSQIEKAILLGLEQKPNLACLTGDYLTNRHFDPALYTQALKKITDQIPCYAVLGNHDQRASHPFSVMMRQIFQDSGIELLHNRSVVIPNPSGKKGTLQLVGVGDTWARECHPKLAFQHHQPGIPTILLSHNPDSKALMKDYPWELMLSGHTHGGQFRLPWIGGRLLAPVHDKNYIEGLVPWEDRHVHITRGIGNLHGIRINCPPEVSLLTCPNT